MAKVIPGPRGWPLLGNIGLIDKEKNHVSMSELKQEYGDIFQFSVFSKRIIVVSDKDLLEKVFAKQELCHRPQNFVTGIKYNRGYLDSNFTDDDTARRASIWKAAASVQGDTVLKGYGVKEVESFLTKLEETEGDVPIFDLLKQSTAKQYAVMLTGVQSDDRHGDAVMEYLNSMLNIHKGGKLALLTMMPWMANIPGSFKSAANRLTHARDQLANTLVTDAKDSRESGQECGILQHLMMDQEAEGTDKAVIGQTLVGCTMDLLYNTVMPTAQNAAFVLLQVIKHPELQEKIRDELNKAGDPTSLGGPHLDKLPYTEVFIWECIRYLGMVNLCVPHLASQDTEIDGYLFPKGSIVFGDLFGIHHDERVWDQPWAFNPNRFLDKEGKRLPKTDPIHKYRLHCCIGMRQCHGDSVAMEIITRYLVGVLSRYKVQPPVDSELPSSDPRDYPTCFVIDVPAFQCRLEKLE